MKFLPTPAYLAAEKMGLPVEAPHSLKDEDLLEKVRAMTPDVFVVSSYGKLIPDAWLEIPAQLSINVHPSLLPKYRGASPINGPILNGDKETGVSIIEVVSKLDAGDIFWQRRIPLEEDMDSESLCARLANRSKEGILEVLQKIEKKTLIRVSQDESKSTLTKKLTKEDGKIEWSRGAREIGNQVRGLLPWPNAYTHYGDELMQILKARLSPIHGSEEKPGQILEIRKDGCLLIGQRGGHRA